MVSVQANLRSKLSVACRSQNLQRQADGSVAIPKALQPYMGGVELIKPAC